MWKRPKVGFAVVSKTVKKILDVDIFWGSFRLTHARKQASPVAAVATTGSITGSN